MKHPALDLLASGLSVIPLVHGEKQPSIPWRDYQYATASADEVEGWAGETGSFGVVTGALSGVVVIDADGPEGLANAHELGVPVTPTVTTGKGRHYYCAHPGQPVSNRAGVRPGLDVRGDGGFVVAPPSPHPNGSTYAWVPGLALGEVPLAPCPAWLLESVTAAQAGRAEGEWGKAFAALARSGERNQRCAELAGYLLRRRVDPDAVRVILWMWNEQRCETPMPRDEVNRVVASIGAREERRRSG